MKTESLTLNLARDNPGCGNAKMAALILHKSGPSFGFNQYKSHPLQAHFNQNPEAIYLHAEIDAIRNACRRNPDELIGASIYVARALKDGTPAISKPCTGCLAALKRFGLAQVTYLDHLAHWQTLPL